MDAIECTGTQISFAGGQCGECSDTDGNSTETAGKNSAGTGCICLKGYESVNGVCKQCRDGKYSANDGGICALYVAMNMRIQ